MADISPFGSSNPPQILAPIETSAAQTLDASAVRKIETWAAILTTKRACLWTDVLLTNTYMQMYASKTWQRTKKSSVLFNFSTFLGRIDFRLQLVNTIIYWACRTYIIRLFGGSNNYNNWKLKEIPSIKRISLNLSLGGKPSRFNYKKQIFLVCYQQTTNMGQSVKSAIVCVNKPLWKRQMTCLWPIHHVQIPLFCSQPNTSDGPSRRKA